MSTQAMPRKSDILARLTEADIRRVYESLGVQRFGNGGDGNWLVKAPFRDDTNPSLTIRKRDGVWHDQATGKGGSIFDAVMLTRNSDFRSALADVAQLTGSAGSMPAPRPLREQSAATVPVVQPVSADVIYPYHDEEGQLLYEVIRRVMSGGKKTFSVRRPPQPGEPSQDGWVWGLSGQRRVLYRLPELLSADPGGWTFVVEGEKDVDRLHALGLTATTNPFGAGKWDESYSASLAGRTVVVVADNDTPGIVHAGNVVAALRDVAHSVRLLRLAELPVGGDLSDWFDLGGTTDQLLRLVEATASDADIVETGLVDAGGGAQRQPAVTASSAPATRRAVVVRLSDVQPKPVDWLWPDWLPLGKLTILGGHPGTGKSTLAAGFAAILSRGLAWPDGVTTRQDEPAHSLFLLGEDSFDDTLRPRLDQLGADPSRISALDLIESEDGSFSTFSVAEDLRLLEAEIEREGTRLVVIDPLTSFLPSANRNDEGDIRDLLTPLAKLAERTGCAILGVMHVAKPGAGKKTALQSLLGATAFGAIARTVIMTAAIPDSERNVLAVVKSNLARKPQPIEWSRDLDGPFTWHGPTTLDVETILGGIPGSVRPEPREEAEDLLCTILADGPVPTREVVEMAANAGLGETTLWRARKAIGIRSERIGGRNGTWYLMLPDTDWDAFLLAKATEAVETTRPLFEDEQAVGDE